MSARKSVCYGGTKRIGEFGLGKQQQQQRNFSVSWSFSKIHSSEREFQSLSTLGSSTNKCQIDVMPLYLNA